MLVPYTPRATIPAAAGSSMQQPSGPQPMNMNRIAPASTQHCSVNCTGQGHLSMWSTNSLILRTYFYGHLDVTTDVTGIPWKRGCRLVSPPGRRNRGRSARRISAASGAAARHAPLRRRGARVGPPPPQTSEPLYPLHSRHNLRGSLALFNNNRQRIK